MGLTKIVINHPLFKPSFIKRIIFFMVVDFFLFFVSLHFAYALRFDFSIPSYFSDNFYTILITLTLLKWSLLYFNGVYHLTWRYFSLFNAKQVFWSLLLANTLFIIFFFIYPDPFLPLPRSVIVIDLFLSLLLIGAFRLSKRVILERQNKPSTKPMLIIGSNHKAAALVKSSKNADIPYSIQAIIPWEESDYHLCGSSIDGIKVYHPDNLKYVCEMFDIHSAAITVELTQKDLNSLVNNLALYDITDIQRLMILEDNQPSLKEISIEELLARHPHDLDTHILSSFIKGKTILITGAGGSIGSEISMQCQLFGAKKLILIDHSEYNLYQIGERLPNATLKLCSILDRSQLDFIMKSHKPDIVVHAAAYKHVPLCEINISVAIENNILGSRNIIDSSIEHKVAKIVIISTDKAVRPTNVMGATKRVVELYAQNIDPKQSEIVAVRFGNVLGSSGSVIPKFKAQIEAGGPLTITHPDITRYFMLISEACQLVLQAASIARGGELFILDMGQPVKIADLAQTMIHLYAAKPIEIVYTGLRPGEKLYEELLIDESEHKTSYESITIAQATSYPIDKLIQDIDTLNKSTDKIEALRTIVPEFNHTQKFPQ